MTEKTRVLRRMREIGEDVYNAKARIKAGDSQTRRRLRERCEDEGADFDDMMARDDMAEAVAKREAAELMALEASDGMRRAVEEMTTEASFEG
jgi:hypothetical protein